ncbi:MAG: sigma-70 family RNA polymerase sigma factor [Myxococcota bacterium]
MEPREQASGRFREDERRWRDWMVRATSGDAAAYHELMSELGEAIEGFLRTRFGAAPFVEDCVQESLLAVHRARDSYDPRRPFRAWLFTIVRHKAIDLLRRQESRGRVEGAGDDALATAAAADADPSLRMDAAVLLNGLEPRYREALELTKLEGLSLADAAARAGTSASAMKTRVHRAVRAVRAALETEEEP